jgi:hypothetical protein
MPQKKREYTFRKNQPVPFESGSIVHKIQKSERETAKVFEHVLGSPKKKKK